MASENETIADIVAEMRSNEFDDPSFNVYSLVAARTLARGWADRIEAAVNQPVTNCNRLGNEAAMREALEKSDAALSLIAKSAWFMDANFCETREVMEAVEAIKAALSAPPRNCDVGTVAEQNERFDKYCYDHRSHEICCGKCPIFGEPCCELAWSQIPYEGGDAK